MKAAKSALLVLLLCAPVSAQTVALGQDAYINNEGEIIIAIDASVAVRKLDSPYIMFMAYFVAKGNADFTVSRDDVVMFYKDNVYPMPTVKELRENYRGELNDTDLYSRMGKESLVLSELRYYRFPRREEFFPDPRRGQVALDRGSGANMIGFVTKLYFKNPGFKKGDELAIVIREKESSQPKGFCAVVLK